MRTRPYSFAAAATALASLLVLSGCGDSAEQPQEGAGESDSALASLTVVEELAEAVPADIRERGTLQVPTAGTAPPLGVVDTAGDIVGITPDLAHALGTVLGLDVQVEAPPFANVLPGVDSGQYDLGITGASITQARLESHDMVAYLALDYTILAKAGNAAAAASEVTDLCGLKIATVQGDSAGEYVSATIAPQCADAGKDAPQVDTYSSSANVDLAVQSGQNDARLNTAIAAEYRAKENPEQWDAADVRFFQGPIGIVVKKDSGFAPVIVDALDHLIEQGSYGEILAKWDSVEAGVAEAVLNPDVVN